MEMAPTLGLDLEAEGDDHVYISPLLIAGVLGHREAFEILLPHTLGRERARVDRIVRQRTGNADRRVPALVRAASEGNEAKVRQLLADGVGPDVLSGKGETPLIAAARAQQPAIVALLLEAGADAHMNNDRYLRPVDMPCDVQTARLLVAAGADLNAVQEYPQVLDEFWLTPLIIAVNTQNLDWINALLEAGASVDGPATYGYTPLMAAAEHGRPAMVRRLLEAGARLECVVKIGRSALDYAMQRDDPETIETLLTGGASLTALDSDGRTPLARALLKHNPRVARKAVQRLLRAGADPNTSTTNGRTPLMLAAGRGDRNLVSVLLARRADRSAVDSEGRTAVDHVPPDCRQREAITRLLEVAP